MPMSLDGLRAWIGEVERKLGARTRVFLVLLAIAIGASGAAIYLALEADDGGGGTASGGATVEEVQSLREQVELEGGGAEVSSLEAQIVELRTELEALKAEGGAGKDGKDAGGGSEPGGGGGAAAEPIPEIEAK
jgi:uncharacterized small protein (DUF1192 family)